MPRPHIVISNKVTLIIWPSQEVLLIYKSPTLCVYVCVYVCMYKCYLLLQFSTDFYKVWFSGICIGQRLYILIFIKIFACLRPLWPPKPRKTFYFITASMPTVRWRQSTLLPGYLPVSCLIIMYLNLT